MHLVTVPFTQPHGTFPTPSPIADPIHLAARHEPPDTPCARARSARPFPCTGSVPFHRIPLCIEPGDFLHRYPMRRHRLAHCYLMLDDHVAGYTVSFRLRSLYLVSSFGFALF